MLAEAQPPVASPAAGLRARRRSVRRRFCSSAIAAESSALTAWLQARGAQVHPALTVSRDAHGLRGLFAALPAAADTLLACIPLACCLADDPSPLAPASAPWPARMAAAVLRAQGDAAWAPVVAALPREAVSVGALAPWSVLRELQLPSALAAAADVAWLAEHPARGDASPDAWAWALSVALSRTCRPHGAPARLLAPLFDMANHAAEADAALRWAWEAGALTLTTARDVAAGEELRICYGEHCSATFYLHYGFVPAQHPADTVALFGCEAHAEQWLSGGGDDACDTLSAEDAAEAALRCGAGGAVDGRLLDLLEARLGGWDAAADAVRRRAGQLLAELPTTAAQDEVALAALPRGHETELPMRARLAHKLILSNLLEV